MKNREIQTNKAYKRHPRRQLRVCDSCKEVSEVVDKEQQQQDMPIQVSEHVRNWLKTNELDSYLRITDVEPHPQVADIVMQIDIDNITNK